MTNYVRFNKEGDGIYRITSKPEGSLLGWVIRRSPRHWFITGTDGIRLDDLWYTSRDEAAKALWGSAR